MTQKARTPTTPYGPLIQEVWQQGDRNQAAALAKLLGTEHAFASDHYAVVAELRY